MGIKETTNHMRTLLMEIMHDLEKALEGNKTASQRVRTNSIKFAKAAKMYRKESIAAEKGVKGKAKKAAAKPAAKKAAPKKAAPKKAAKAAKKR
jgi:DNA-binding protein H-NS